MPVRFVIGRSGSGKTKRCFERIVAALKMQPLGPPIYWILPRQATFETERHLTCEWGLPGFCRVRVIGFHVFGQEILGAGGGTELPLISATGRQMILGHLLRRHRDELTFFRTVDRQAGLAAELDATFDELERAGKSADDLAMLLDDLSHSGPVDVEARSLAAKLADVQLLYKAYNEFLGQDRLDQHRRLQQVLDSVSACSFIPQSTIYVDGFLDFSHHERQLLCAVAKAGADVEITLLMDPASPLLANPHLNPVETSLFHRTERTYRQLWTMFTDGGVMINEPLVLDSPVRTTAAALKRIERDMFPLDGLSSTSEAAADDDAAGAIERIEAPDRAAEVDAVARRVQSLLRQGHRLRDIAVLARNFEDYHPLLTNSFNEHGIPFFVDRRRAASHHPLVCFLRSALQAARFDWRHDAIVAMMKTGLAGLSFVEADELENYILQHHVTGKAWESDEPWPWKRGQALLEEEERVAEEDPLYIDNLRRKISDGLLPLVRMIQGGAAVCVREIAGEIFAVLKRFAVREQLSQWMDALEQERGEAAMGSEDPGKLDEQRDVHEQVWNSLCELFDELVDLLGDEKLSMDDFADVVDAGLEQFDLGITPPTVDRVLVGPVDRTKCPPVKSVFVMGLNEGDFPARPHEGTVLTDRDRLAMSKRRVELDADGRRKLFDERLLAYAAFTQPSERLICSRPMGDGSGRAAAPSAFWHRISEMFPNAVVNRPSREGNATIDQIATPRQFVTGLMRQVRVAERQTPQVLPQEWLGLYDWLRADGEKHAALAHLREHAWPALSYSNEANLSPELAPPLFAAPLMLNIRQLETMAACPFKHYLRYGLDLRQRERAKVSGGDLSAVYHQLLDKLINDATTQKRQIGKDEIAQAAQDAAKLLRGELMLSSARNRYLLRRIEETVAGFLAPQRTFMKRSKFRPAKMNVSFGNEKKNAPALKVISPAGADMYLRGKIDRIDTHGDDAIVIDYRLGARSLSLAEAHYGLSLELLVSLLALQADSEQLAGKKVAPAAAFYAPLMRGFKDVNHPSEAPDPTSPEYLLANKPRGIFDSRVLGVLDNELTSGWSQALHVFISKNGSIGHANKSDCADTVDFNAVLQNVATVVGKIGDDILSGNVAIQPYRMSNSSACPSCEYRGICRFETPANRYNTLVPIGRVELLATLRGEEPDVKA